MVSRAGFHRWEDSHGICVRKLCDGCNGICCNTGGDAHGYAEAYGDTYFYAEADSNTYCNTEAYGNSYFDSETDSDTYFDSDSDADSCCHQNGSCHGNTSERAQVRIDCE